jgi:superoxide oxidase
MSAQSEVKDAAELTASVESYDRFMKAVHWSTLLLIAAAYGAVWTSHAVASKEQHAVLVELHRSLGVTVFALTLFRLGWRSHARIPSLPADLPLLQKAAARATEYILYALLLAQPMLGILHTNAQGRKIDFYLLGELPAVIGRDKTLAKQAIAAHDIVSYLLLAVIALHAAAALFHHFGRRDNVLSAMLPGRGR